MDNKYLCLECRHLYFEEEDPGYSEYTPGSPMEFSCLKKHWDSDDWGGRRDIASSLDKGATCKDFEEDKK